MSKSKLNKKAVFSFILTFHLLTLTADSAFCSNLDKQSLLTKKLTLSQKKIKNGQVYISRPAILDEKIRSIIIFNEIFSIEEYITWLKNNIEYEADTNQDIWSNPMDTLKKGAGDCEDLAFLSAAFLKVYGHHPKIIGIFLTQGKKHAICVFKNQGRYYWIDNFRLIKTNASTFQELSDYFFNRYNCHAIVELILEKNIFKLIARKI